MAAVTVGSCVWAEHEVHWFGASSPHRSMSTFDTVFILIASSLRIASSLGCDEKCGHFPVMLH